MASDYYLLFKTAPAEFRAWEQLSSENQQLIHPIVELTRGRKRRGAGEGLSPEALVSTPDVYAFDRIVERVCDTFSDVPRVIFDITREDSLNSYELNALSSDENGYEQWINFLLEQKDYFEDLIPTLLVNPDDEDDYEEYEENLTRQAARALENFSGVAYRAAVLFDPEFLSDIAVLSEVLNDGIEDGKDVIIILDHEFIRPGTSIVHAARSVGLIESIRRLIPEATIVTLATSFPRVIEDLGDAEHDSFPMEEVLLNQEINRVIDGDPVEYGDYGSINPTRNDIMFATGWRPRIDFPTSRLRTYYYRQKRVGDYADHYASVAEDVRDDNRFEEIEDCWGCEMIKEAADGNVLGKSPSFWISVRMNIHIHQQINRIYDE